MSDNSPDSGTRAPQVFRLDLDELRDGPSLGANESLAGFEARLTSFALAGEEVAETLRRAVAKVGRAPSEASAGFSALESSCTGGLTSRSDGTVATDAIAHDLSTLSSDDESRSSGYDDGVVGVTTPRASTTVSAATSALGIADMSDLASVELGHRNPADRPTEAAGTMDAMCEAEAATAQLSSAVQEEHASATRAPAVRRRRRAASRVGPLRIFMLPLCGRDWRQAYLI